VKRKRFSVEQITGILKQADLGTPIQELCRVHGVSEQSYYRWKKIYGGMEPSEARELKQLRGKRTSSSSAWWRTCPWTKRCSRTFSKKNSEACQEARDGDLLDQQVRRGQQTGLPLHSAAPLDVLLP
jgi:Transposase